MTWLLDPGESQLMAPGSLSSADAAEPQTLIMTFPVIKVNRLPKSFNRVLEGATGCGRVHRDLGFLSSGWLHWTLSSA
jgi:hypothetical protein